MNKSFQKDQDSITDSHLFIQGQWVWTLLGALLGALILLLIYLSSSQFNPLLKEPTTDHSITHYTTGQILRSDPALQTATNRDNAIGLQGEIFPPFETDSESPGHTTAPATNNTTKPTFTFYKELKGPSDSPSITPIIPPIEQPVAVVNSDQSKTQSSAALAQINTSQPHQLAEPSRSASNTPKTVSQSMDESTANIAAATNAATAAKTTTEITTEKRANTATHAQPPPTFSVVDPNNARPTAQTATEAATSTSTKPAQDEQNSSTPSLTAKRYLLQTGSFKNQLQADRHRAKLLLEGYNAAIREVTLGNGATWHRVLLGPFDHSKAKQLQGQLEADKIPSQLRRQHN